MVRHVIVVGAGPGGLSAAINLAGQGLKVTVVEKDTVPGGRMKGLTLGERGEYALEGPATHVLGGSLRSLRDALPSLSVERAAGRLREGVWRLCRGSRGPVAGQTSSSGKSVRSNSSSGPRGRQPGGGGVARSAALTCFTRSW